MCGAGEECHVDDAKPIARPEHSPQIGSVARAAGAEQAALSVRGTFSVLLLYDVGEELDLEKLRALLQPNADTAQRTFRRRTPSYVQFEYPPVLERMGNIQLRSGEGVYASHQVLFLRRRCCGVPSALRLPVGLPGLRGFALDGRRRFGGGGA